MNETDFDIKVGYETPAPFKFVRGAGWQDPQGDYPGADAMRALEVKAQPEPEHRCETCRLWLKYSGVNYKGRGECLLPSEEDSPVTIDMWGDCGVELVTPASWHCAGWQQRPPSPEGGTR